ncbi:putative GNAT superfamily acetyltransferase [Agromyces cerinus]|uniref:hypothetical protein n=1 Tax=Agromyces cerinus TaxID=33878 RepID=UPI001957B41E|nr:hypothetical protein [Agromyces cerinus]MBM7829812.1 putative GNAT superfamily acetyltransferase [Agromyces cerinus]
MRTDPRQPSVAAGSAAAIAATELADAADAHAGVETRQATGGELDRALAGFEATWGVGRGPDRSMLQAIAHAGNTLLVAVQGFETRASLAPRPAGGDVVGATLGFLGWEGGLHLHSHMNAVDPAARGRGIGLALKLRQRALCLEHGVDEIRWTYDPLIRRNARMNLVRLGAEVAAFHPDFYGRLDDAITGADRSDRFEVRWRLASARTARALALGPQPAWSARAGFALVPDFEALRADAPADAARLREHSHEAFAALAAPGLRPELDAAGDYVFTSDDPDREAE